MITQPKKQKPSAHMRSEEEPFTGLFFNILPFDYPDAENLPLHEPKIPGDASGNLWEGTAADPVPEYQIHSGSTPGIRKNENSKVSVPLHPEEANEVLTRHIRRVLAPQTEFCYTQSSGRTQFWCRDKNNGKESLWQRHHRFTLEIQHDWPTGRPGLQISYDGEAFILKQSLEELQDMHPDTRLFRLAAFRKRIYRWNHLPEAAWYHPGELFPVLNRRVADWLGEPYPAAPDHDCCTRYSRLIREFADTRCMSEEFRSAVPHNGVFKPVPADAAGRLNASTRLLLFGEGRRDSDPLEGLKKYGPLKRPAGSHFCYFFIYFSHNQAETGNLARCIAGEDGQVRLNRLTCLNLTHVPEQDIAITGDGDAAGQVERCLLSRWFDPQVTWYAFYISPYSGKEKDEKQSQLYYRIKELLLYRQVSMQAVKAENLQGNFGHALTNIGCALVAKLGGVPWRLEGNGESEPVIGLRLTRRKGSVQPEAAAIACFTQEGLFRGFDVFSPFNPLTIAGSALEAFLLYRQEHPGLKRLVIHCHQPLNAEQLDPLLKLLADMKLDIPVVVAVIGQSGSKSRMAFCKPQENPMPVNGTWVRFGQYSYLLYVNSHRNQEGTAAEQAMPLHIRFVCTRPGYLDAQDTVSGLLDQIYTFCFMHWHTVKQSPLPVTLTYPARLASFVPRFSNRLLPAHGRSVAWFI